MKLAAMSLGAGSIMGSTSDSRAALSQVPIRSAKTRMGSQLRRTASNGEERELRKAKPRAPFMRTPQQPRREPRNFRARSLDEVRGLATRVGQPLFWLINIHVAGISFSQLSRIFARRLAVDRCDCLARLRLVVASSFCTS